MGGREATTHTGILNVDKPLGMTSHDVVAAIRKMAHQHRVGHAGTLDPLATGVLLVCLGRATRVSEYLMRSPKRYLAAVRLGITTTTDDAEGEVIGRSPAHVDREQVKEALRSFVGHIRQVPPRYAAIKQGGKPLYELARQGKAVEAPVREVDVYAVQIVGWAPPVVHLDVHCGPGTYIRAIARDLGAALGCGAHLAALRRTASGQFSADQASSLESLAAAFVSGSVAPLLYPLAAAFPHLPVLQLDLEQARRLAMGGAVEGPDRCTTVKVFTDLASDPAGDEGLAQCYAPGGRFMALVRYNPETGAWTPHRVFLQPDEIDLEPLDDHVCSDQ